MPGRIDLHQTYADWIVAEGAFLGPVVRRGHHRWRPQRPDQRGLPGPRRRGHADNGACLSMRSGLAVLPVLEGLAESLGSVC